MQFFQVFSIIPILFDIFCLMWSMCVFHVNWGSNFTPRNFISKSRSIWTLFMVRSRSGSCLLVGQYIIYCVLIKLKDNTLQFIHVCIFFQFFSNISLLSLFVFVDKEYIYIVCKWYRPVFFWNCGQIINRDKKKEWSQYRTSIKPSAYLNILIHFLHDAFEPLPVFRIFW